jgi:hypothetical protein
VWLLLYSVEPGLPGERYHMIAVLRKYAYTISVLAVVCFFLFPEPNLAIIGALLLQTLAYIVIAGQSTADSIVLTGISVILIGSLPADHPLIHGPYFQSVRPWIIVTGIGVFIFGLVLVGRQLQRRH